MIIDARSLPTGTVLDTDICIIGAGAAGITLARAFADAPFQVVVLESGGMDYEPDTQALYDGRSVGRSFQKGGGGELVDLTTSRLRYFGGSTNHWGGWSLPYDPIDFEAREGLPYHGWPFGKSYLDPWYQRAQEVCQLAPYDCRPANWGISTDAIPPPFLGPHFECRVWQQHPLRFGLAYASELRQASGVTVYLHANAFHLDGGESETEVQKLLVKTLSGINFTVHARIYILAAGGIENARLLLTSGKEEGSGLGNTNDLVGRFLMVHLNYPGGMIAVSDPHVNLDFMFGPNYLGSADQHLPVPDQHVPVPFIGLSESTMKRFQLPQMNFIWGYKFFPVVKSIKALRRLIRGEGPGGSLMADFSEVVGNLDGVASFAARKLLYGDGIPIEALGIGCSSEQQPNPLSRVFLGPERDRLGMRKVNVDWQLTAEDKTKAAATLRLLGSEVGRVGFGRLRSTLSDDDAWPDDLYGDPHHIGTTRMHNDPMLGVVDKHCRVHSVANLFLAGSSVFPNSSANKSTLTIVALALRLADHIKKQFT